MVSTLVQRGLFFLSLVIFDGLLVAYHGHANNITCHLVD